MSDVFISYSRKDKELVTRMVEHLQSVNCDVWLDTGSEDNIPPGTKWRDEIVHAIENAACLVVVVSQASIESPVVSWEIEQALQLDKRLIPLIVDLAQDQISTSGKETAQDGPGPIDFSRLPKWIGEPQVLDARATVDWQPVFEQVTMAVREDYDWRRESAEVLVRARRWREGSGALLLGPDLNKANAWLEQEVPPYSKPPGDLQLSFIRASEEARQREQKQRADSLANLIFSGFDDPDLAIPLASRNINENTSSPSAVAALDYALRQSRSLGAIGFSDDVCLLRFQEDGRRLMMAYRDASVDLIDVENGDLLSSWRHDGSGASIRAMSRQGKVIVQDGGLCIEADISTGKSRRLSYRLPAELADADYDASGRWLLIADRYGDAWLWDRVQDQPVCEMLVSEEIKSIRQRLKKELKRLNPVDIHDGVLKPRITVIGEDKVRVALSDDARYAAIGRDVPRSGYYLLTVHDARTGYEVMQKRFTWEVTSLVFRPGSHDLLYVYDGEGFLRPFPNGDTMRLHRGLSSIAGALVGSPDGRLGAAMRRDGMLQVFEFEGEKNLMLVGGHDFQHHIAPDLSTEGYLVSGLVKGEVRLWEIRDDIADEWFDVRAWPTNAVVLMRDPGIRPIEHVGISPDGSRISVTAKPLTAGIRQVDASEPDPVELYPAPAAKPRHLAWLPDGSLLGIPYEMPQLLLHYTPHDEGYGSKELINRYAELEEGSDAEILANFPLTPEQQDERIMLGAHNALEVSADGSRFAVQIGATGLACEPALIEVWSLEPLRRLVKLDGDGLLALSPDGKRLLRADSETGYAIWSVEQGKVTHDSDAIPVGRAYELGAWAPQGGYYALAQDNSLSLICEAGDNRRMELFGHRSDILAMTFSRSGDLLATASRDGGLRVWEVSSGEEIRRFDQPGAAITSLCFTPDGSALISGSADGRVRTWRILSFAALSEIAESRCVTLDDWTCRRFGLSTSGHP